MVHVKREKVVKVIKKLPIPRRWPISVVSGIALIVIFWAFTLTSMSLYPQLYNPMTNWMSDLGSSKLNPEGAIIYNMGCIITGIVMFFFFIGLYEWYIGGKRNRNLTIMTQISGFYCAFAMIMLGIFPEDYFEIHIFWAISLFITTVFTPSFLIYSSPFPINSAEYFLTKAINAFSFSISYTSSACPKTITLSYL